MYLFHPTSTLAVYSILFLLVRVKALYVSLFPSQVLLIIPTVPRPQSSPLVQRAPTDLRNKTTIELDDIRDILVGSERSPPTGKVTLEADARWDMDKRWLVYDVKGLVDGDGKPMTATATTRVDGSSIDPRLIDVRSLAHLPSYYLADALGINRRMCYLGTATTGRTTRGGGCSNRRSRTILGGWKNWTFG